MSPSTNEEPFLAALLVAHVIKEDPVRSAVLVYERAFDRLAPIVGGNGVHALFARSVGLARKGAPLLATFAVGAEPRSAAEPLVALLGSVPPSVAQQAVVTLHASFFGLIVKFVGRDLTGRLLQSAFPDIDVAFEETK